MSGLQEKQGHVKVEDGMAVIYVPASEIHGLLVALQPCPCKGPKSNATADVRKRMTAAQLQAFYKADGDHSAPRQDREGPIHKGILQLLDLALPGDAIYHHSPNELDMAGAEAARQIAKARKLGTKPGWPDIEIIWQGRAFFLEVKADSRQSDAQKDIQRDLVRAGAPYAVVRSVTEAEAILKLWGLI